MQFYKIYVRVSKDEQQTEHQLKACVDYVKRTAKEPYQIEIYNEESLTSRVKLEQRHELMKMMSDIHRGDIIVVFKLDRLSRDVIEMTQIHRDICQCGAQIHSLNDSGCDDEFTVSLMGLIANKERSDISKRVKARLHAKRDKRERISRWIPYGYDLSEDGINLHVNEDEQVVIQKMIKLLNEGYSYQMIEDVLFEEGVRTRKGTPLKKMSIYRVLKREGYQRDVTGKLSTPSLYSRR